MGSGSAGGLSRRAFVVALLAIGGCVLVQSAVHLVVVLNTGRIDSLVDLDRSNGLPDIASTIALASAAAGAAALCLVTPAHRAQLAALAAVLGTLAVADLIHDGAHPSSTAGWIVIVLVAVGAALLLLELRRFAARANGLLMLALAALAASFLVTGLDRYTFERERGDPVREYQIVAKEGLELLGWSVVAVVLWDEALRRRRGRVATARASRAPAAPTRHVV